MKYDQVILGENCEYSMDSESTGVNNNVLVIGGTGCGKTMSISEPRLLGTCNSSLITTVTKRRIVDKYAPQKRREGYEVLELNFADAERSTVGYDALDYIGSYEDITDYAQSVVASNPKKKRSNEDPYWDDCSVSLLSALMAYCMMTKEHATMADVMRMIDRMNIRDGVGQIETDLDQKFSTLAERRPDCFAVARWNTFRNLPIKTASCVYSTLKTSLDRVFTPSVLALSRKKRRVDFRSIAGKKTLLFVVTSPMNQAQQSFINLFYAQAFKELFEFAEEQPEGVLPIPVHILCDDFATGGRVQDFDQHISIFREKGISVTVLLQSLTQLESMYGEKEATTVVNNFDTMVYMGGMDLGTARNMSQRANLPLEDVLYMPIGQIMVFRRGQRPTVTQRYNILANPMYQKITEEYKIAVEGSR